MIFIRFFFITRANKLFPKHYNDNFLGVIHLETKAKKQTNKFLKILSNEMQILKYKASFS